jgi:hypothetical protein
MCLRPVRLAVVLGLLRAPTGLVGSPSNFSHSLDRASTSPLAGRLAPAMSCPVTSPVAASSRSPSGAMGAKQRRSETVRRSKR